MQTEKFKDPNGPQIILHFFFVIQIKVYSETLYTWSIQV